MIDDIIHLSAEEVRQLYLTPSKDRITITREDIKYGNPYFTDILKEIKETGLEMTKTEKKLYKEIFVNKNLHYIATKGSC